MERMKTVAMLHIWAQHQFSFFRSFFFSSWLLRRTVFGAKYLSINRRIHFVFKKVLKILLLQIYVKWLLIKMKKTFLRNPNDSKLSPPPYYGKEYFLTLPRMPYDPTLFTLSLSFRQFSSWVTQTFGILTQELTDQAQDPGKFVPNVYLSCWF